MEVGETLEQATQREVQEEANASIEVDSLLATYSIPRIGQVHMVYLCRLTSPEFHAGPESLDVQLFPMLREGLPKEALAFPVNDWTFRDYFSLDGQLPTQPFTMQEADFDDRMSEVLCHPDFPEPR